MKYIFGDFQVLLFGDHGDKIKTKTAESYHNAVVKARKHEAKNPRYSAVVTRVVYNSINDGHKWSYNG